MRINVRSVLLFSGCAIAFLGTAYALDRSLPHPFREYPGIEYRLGSIPLPSDYQEKTEWAFARLNVSSWLEQWLSGAR